VSEALATRGLKKQQWYACKRLGCNLINVKDLDFCVYSCTFARYKENEI